MKDIICNAHYAPSYSYTMIYSLSLYDGNNCFELKNYPYYDVAFTDRLKDFINYMNISHQIYTLTFGNAVNNFIQLEKYEG